jgi:predicted amidohydrolase
MARIIAAAQFAALPADLAANLDRHLRIATVAAGLGVQLLVFPELSLTGYELQRAESLVVNPYSPVFEPLKTLARESSMTILAGAPVRFSSSGLHIGQLAFLPDGMVAIYTKRHVHSSEKPWFQDGQGGPILRVGSLMVAMAICADIAHPSHAASAAAHRANVYAASVLLSAAAYPAESALLAGYARTHSMAVLMANHSAPTGDYIPAGRSAIWDEQGNLIAASPDTEESLVLARRRGRSWEGAVFPLKPSNPTARIPEPTSSPATPPAPSVPTPSATPDQGHLFHNP